MFLKFCFLHNSLKFLSLSSLQDESTTTLAGLLTTSGYSNDINKNTNSSDGKASSRESRGEVPFSQVMAESQLK